MTLQVLDFPVEPVSVYFDQSFLLVVRLVVRIDGRLDTFVHRVRQRKHLQTVCASHALLIALDRLAASQLLIWRRPTQVMIVITQAASGSLTMVRFRGRPSRGPPPHHSPP